MTQLILAACQQVLYPGGVPSTTGGIPEELTMMTANAMPMNMPNQNMPMMGMNPMMNMGMPMMGMNPMMNMGMPMMNGMMGGMMPMGMNPMMNGMMPMMNPMMNMGMGGMGMPMMMPMMMQMPMQMRQMMPMMARMTCEMGKDGMVCKMMPMEGQDMAMMKECCDAMNSMMAMGAPMMMMCNGMPMMMCMTK